MVGGATMIVESLAVSFVVFVCPPPETVTTGVNGDPALDPTSTVNLSALLLPNPATLPLNVAVGGKGWLESSPFQ